MSTSFNEDEVTIDVSVAGEQVLVVFRGRHSTTTVTVDHCQLPMLICGLRQAHRDLHRGGDIPA